MSEKSREEKLEAAFIQFIKDVVDLRKKQKKFDENYGADLRKLNHLARARVDQDLKDMGITDEMDLTDIRISFLKTQLSKPCS